jgi:organic radical activating enzyme|nr:MAG TPA: tungsten cofactor oxidoreductase radical SAM maturase [Caudoviricetes sp.]
MKDFTHWGIRQRLMPEYNYNGIWNNLATVRIGEGVAGPLPPNFSEFYDVGINTLCNAECPFCYVSASNRGRNFENICETWLKWMKTFPDDIRKGAITRTLKPFQIAIGSTGEPTIHPDFINFLKTVYESGVVPNYTTNGIVLSELSERAEELIEVTGKYCGGVAVSFGNKDIRDRAYMAVEKLLANRDINVNIHHIISDKKSVKDFLNVYGEYTDEIRYHVLLPLMPEGRSTEGLDPEAWDMLEMAITRLGIDNVAFGANFVKNLESSSIKTWLYPPESLSKNVILEKDCVKITPSSFDLTPMMEICL